MIKLIESTITNPIILASNSSDVIFQNERRTRSATCCGWLQHNEGSPVYTIISPGLYDVELTATLTSANTGVVGLAIKEDDSPLLNTIGAETIGAANDLVNISAHTVIKVCPRGNTQIEVGSVPTIVTAIDGTVTDTIAPTIVNATLDITRISGC